METAACSKEGSLPHGTGHLEIPLLTHPLVLAFLTWPDQRGFLGDKDRAGVVSSFSLRDSESQNLVFGAGKGHQGLSVCAQPGLAGCLGSWEVTGHPWLCVGQSLGLAFPSAAAEDLLFPCRGKSHKLSLH